MGGDEAARNTVQPSMHRGVPCCASPRRRDAQGRAPLAPPRPRRRPRRATRAMFLSVRCCTRWCRRTTRISSHVLRPKIARFPSTCTRNSRNTCAAVYSTTASCGGVRAVPCGTAGGVFLQEARVLPELRRAAHGRVGAALGRGGVWPAPSTAMGAELSLPLALSVRQQARRHRPGTGDCASRDRALVSRSGGRAAGGGAVRRGDADPAFWQRAELEHPLSGARLARCLDSVRNGHGRPDCAPT
jgi:hypothetical protein